MSFVPFGYSRLVGKAQENGWTLEHLALVSADLGAWDWDIPTNRVVWSDHVYEQYRTNTFGGTVEAFVELVHPLDRDRVAAQLAQVVAVGPDEWSIEHRLASDDEVWLFCRGRVFRDDEGRGVRMAGVVQDITERRAIEEALRQSQKLEAIGRLAGGVAHDFNNLLTAILSFASLGRRHAHSPATLLQDLDEITSASERAAALTRQLLAFGRRDSSRPVVFDARERVSESVRMLSRMVGEHVSIKVHQADTPCWVKMDAGQLEQVLVNLAVNARDAMRAGGSLELALEHVVREGARWVQLRVSDTGTGMDEATRLRAIEPYFTTKPLHEGTGLGLATSHGIVTNAGGTLCIESELGRGTSVFVRLPLVDAPNSEAHAPAPPSAPIVGRGRLLVVEDDPSVRNAAVHVLRASGYDVVAAANGEDAIHIARTQPIDLVVCDVVLPGRDGFEVIAAMRREAPIKALFVSGYTGENPRHSDDPFLAKPYTPDVLDARVRELLAAR